MTPGMLIERAVYLGNFIVLFETREGEMRTIDFKPLLKGYMGLFKVSEVKKFLRNFILILEF